MVIAVVGFASQSGYGNTLKFCLFPDKNSKASVLHTTIADDGQKRANYKDSPFFVEHGCRGRESHGKNNALDVSKKCGAKPERTWDLPVFYTSGNLLVSIHLGKVEKSGTASRSCLQTVSDRY